MCGFAHHASVFLTMCTEHAELASSEFLSNVFIFPTSHMLCREFEQVTNEVNRRCVRQQVLLCVIVQCFVSASGASQHDMKTKDGGYISPKAGKHASLRCCADWQ